MKRAINCIDTNVSLQIFDTTMELLGLDKAYQSQLQKMAASVDKQDSKTMPTHRPFVSYKLKCTLVNLDQVRQLVVDLSCVHFLQVHALIEIYDRLGVVIESIENSEAEDTRLYKDAQEMLFMVGLVIDMMKVKVNVLKKIDISPDEQVPCHILEGKVSKLTEFVANEGNRSYSNGRHGRYLRNELKEKFNFKSKTAAINATYEEEWKQMELENQVHSSKRSFEESTDDEKESVKRFKLNGLAMDRGEATKEGNMAKP